MPYNSSANGFRISPPHPLRWEGFWFCSRQLTVSTSRIWPLPVSQSQESLSRPWDILVQQTTDSCFPAAVRQKHRTSLTPCLSLAVVLLRFASPLQPPEPVNINPGLQYSHSSACLSTQSIPLPSRSSITVWLLALVHLRLTMSMETLT